MLRLTLAIISILLLTNCAWSFSPASPLLDHERRSGATTNGVPFKIKPSFSSGTSSDAFTSPATMNIETEEDKATADSATARISIPRPKIHYTVPGFKVGWRDEETGTWYDEDGPRNGPPLNIWRQASDEREYKADMDAVDAVLADFDVATTLRDLEIRCGVRKPALSRKVLGSWAPLLRGGRRVVYSDRPSGNVEVPMTVDVYRTTGRKLGPKNHYGQFDARLEDGEGLTIETAGVVALCAAVVVDGGNRPIAVGNVECGGDADAPLTFGGITYISDYVLIQRNEEGDPDFWLRCDDSYFGEEA